MVLLPCVILVFVFADIAGWVFHIPLLTSVIPTFPTMKPNTALALGLLAVCCLVRGKRGDEQQGRPRRTPISALAIAMVLSCGTLVEYASGRDLGIDNSLLAVSFDRFGDAPGRMAFGTALCLTFTGLALGLLDKAPRPALWMLMATNVITLSALVSFAINTQPIFAPSWLRSLSVPTALCLLLLAVAALSSRPERRRTPFLSASETGSGGTRSRLIDSFIVLPLLMAAPWVVAMHARISEAVITLLIMAVFLYSARTWLEYAGAVKEPGSEINAREGLSAAPAEPLDPS